MDPSAANDQHEPFEPNEKGHWALHYAVMKNDPDRIRRHVVERGHPIDAQDNDNNTALHWAVWGRRVDMAKTLLDLGADPNVANHKGHTVMHHLFTKIEDGQDADLLSSLLDHGANGLARDKSGNTPYHMLAMASWRSTNAACLLAEILCQRVGLRGWADRNNDGLTPIACARAQNNGHWMLGFAAAIENSVLETSTPMVANTSRKPGARL